MKALVLTDTGGHCDGEAITDGTLRVSAELMDNEITISVMRGDADDRRYSEAYLSIEQAKRLRKYLKRVITEGRTPVTQAKVLEQVAIERAAQLHKWGEQNHPNGTGGTTLRYAANDARARCDAIFALGRGTWRHILSEEVAEAYAETDPAALRGELVQVAAVAVAWIEAIDRKAA